MSKTIWKYAVSLSDEVVIEMPKGAEILHAEIGRLSIRGVPAQIWIWAIVDRGAPIENRHFSIRGTGHDLGFAAAHYIATLMDGPFVWHLFESEVR